MKKSCRERIAWIKGSWGTINNLSIPLNDRGLSLGDGIFETILVFNGKPRLLNQHLQRWRTTAEILKIDNPPNQVLLESLIDEGIQRARLHNGNGSIRLNLTRGASDNRGLNISHKNNADVTNNFWLEISNHDPSFEPLITTISRHERRNAHSQLSQCKTLEYGQSIKARHEAILLGFDDALLLSTTGEMCCGTTANVIIKRDGKWITPPLKSGCLPGIMRQEGIRKGLIQELTIEPYPKINDEWLLINSLSCKAIKRIETRDINEYTNPQELWLSLLDK